MSRYPDNCNHHNAGERLGRLCVAIFAILLGLGSFFGLIYLVVWALGVS